MRTQPEPDKEILAITAVYAALKELDAPAQARVIEYVLKKLDLSLQTRSDRRADERQPDEIAKAPKHDESPGQNYVRRDSPSDEFTGVSPVAQRWVQRTGLTAKQLSSIFTLGGDEIDLVANKVPGKSARARMHSVFLLKGVAAYLGGGAARFAHDKVKETCVHYDAYDVANFAKSLKEFAPEVSGSKESGYTLTARGLSNAAELVKEMAGAKKSE